MKTITATELARNLRRVLDRLAIEGEEIVIERNREQVARLLPGPARQTALEAMADLYRTLPEDAAANWEADSRKGRWKGTRLDKGVRDPWASW
jgi:antitoxin (DNA-binding transcriptional repressor) of toxin-antitoxin stability system